METSVWQLIVQAAGFLSSLSGRLSATQPLESGGVSPSAQGSDADSTSTSTSATTLAVTRDPALATSDALFGRMYVNRQYIGFTMERTAVAIPEGTYPGCKRDSRHFGMKVVGIAVPNRTDIECHPANHPCQLEGCIAEGESIDGDALDNSRAAFDEMMNDLPDEFTVVVASKS